MVNGSVCRFLCYVVLKNVKLEVLKTMTLNIIVIEPQRLSEFIKYFGVSNGPILLGLWCLKLRLFDINIYMFCKNINL